MWNALEAHLIFAVELRSAARYAPHQTSVYAGPAVPVADLELVPAKRNYRVRPVAQPSANCCQRGLPELRHTTHYIRERRAS